MKTAPIAAFLFLFAARAFAQDEHVGARLREWYAKMDGNLRSTGSGVPGTDIDLASDLGLDQSRWTPEVQAYARLPFFGRLYGGWWGYRNSADQILSETLSFAGQSFTASTEVRTDVALDVYYFSYEFVFPSLPLGELVGAELGILAGVRVLHASGSIQSSAGSGQDSGTVPIPVLGAHATVTLLDWLRGEVEVMGLEFSAGGRSGTYLEAYAEVVVQPVSFVFAGVGYKFARVNLKDSSGSNSFSLDVDLKGVYLTAGLRF